MGTSLCLSASPEQIKVNFMKYQIYFHLVGTRRCLAVPRINKNLNRQSGMKQRPNVGNTFILSIPCCPVTPVSHSLSSNAPILYSFDRLGLNADISFFKNTSVRSATKRLLTGHRDHLVIFLFTRVPRKWWIEKLKGYEWNR